MRLACSGLHRNTRSKKFNRSGWIAIWPSKIDRQFMELSSNHSICTVTYDNTLWSGEKCFRSFKVKYVFMIYRHSSTIYNKTEYSILLNNNIDRTESILNQSILFEFIFPAGFCVPQRQQATCHVYVPFLRDCTVHILSVISCLMFVSKIKMRRWENPDATKYVVSTQRTMDAECFFSFPLY